VHARERNIPQWAVNSRFQLLVWRRTAKLYNIQVVHKDTELEEFGNISLAHIHIPSGTHKVKCEAFIDVMGDETEICRTACYEVKTITVVVALVGT